MRSLAMLVALFVGLSACGLRNIDDLYCQPDDRREACLCDFNASREDCPCSEDDARGVCDSCPADDAREKCKPQTLYEAEPPAAGAFNEVIFSIAANEETVYFSSFGPLNAIKTFKKDDSELVTSYAILDPARDIAVQDRDVFYSSTTTAGMSNAPCVHTTNASAEIVLPAVMQSVCNGLVTSEQFIYIASDTGLWRSNLQGSDTPLAIPDPARTGEAIKNNVAVGRANDDDVIVFTTIDGACSSLDATSAGAQGSVYSWYGQGASMLDTGPGCRFAIAADDSHVFWVDLDAGTLVKTALDAEAGDAKVVSDGHDKPVSVALDDEHVYWLNIGEQKGSTGELRRWDRQTGKEELLLGELAAPADIVLEGDYIYWTLAGTNPDALAAVQRRHK